MKRVTFLIALALSLTIMLSTVANASPAWSVRTFGVSQESDTSTSEEKPEYSVWYDAVIHHTEDGGFEVVVAYPHYFEIEYGEEVWDPTNPESEVYYDFEMEDDDPDSEIFYMDFSN